MGEWNDILTIATLIVGAITLFFTVLSYLFSRKNRKETLLNSIRSKQIEIDSINDRYFNSMTKYMGFPEKGQMELRKEVLEREIKELKKLL